MKNENKPDQEFTKIEPHILTKRLVICSHCGAEMSSVDHMIDEPHIFTTEWYCPKCERGTEMKVGQGKLLTRKGKQYQPTVLALLFHGDLALVVNAGAVDGKTDGLSYFFDEHTCPTNYLSRIRMIIDLKKRIKYAEGDVLADLQAKLKKTEAKLERFQAL